MSDIFMLFIATAGVLLFCLFVWFFVPGIVEREMDVALLPISHIFKDDERGEDDIKEDVNDVGN